MSTHVYVLQRLKALGDGENEATILHWTLWESALNAYCSEVQRTDYTHIYTVHSIQTGKCLGQKISAEDCLSAKVIKGHSILYRQPMEIKV